MQSCMFSFNNSSFNFWVQSPHLYFTFYDTGIQLIQEYFSSISGEIKPGSDFATKSASWAIAQIFYYLFWAFISLPLHAHINGNKRKS